MRIAINSLLEKRRHVFRGGEIERAREAGPNAISGFALESKASAGGTFTEGGGGEWDELVDNTLPRTGEMKESLVDTAQNCERRFLTSFLYSVFLDFTVAKVSLSLDGRRRRIDLQSSITAQRCWSDSGAS